MLRAEFEISGILFAVAYVLLLEFHWVYIVLKGAYVVLLLLLSLAPIGKVTKYRLYIALTIALAAVGAMLFLLGFR